MGIYSWVGAWNLNRQQHCSGQVLHGGQTGCMLGNSGGEGRGSGRSRGGNRDEDRRSPLEQHANMSAPLKLTLKPADVGSPADQSEGFKYDLHVGENQLQGHRSDRTPHISKTWSGCSSAEPLCCDMSVFFSSFVQSVDVLRWRRRTQRRCSRWSCTEDLTVWAWPWWTER